MWIRWTAQERPCAPWPRYLTATGTVEFSPQHGHGLPGEDQAGGRDCPVYTRQPDEAAVLGVHLEGHTSATSTKVPSTDLLFGKPTWKSCSPCTTSSATKCAWLLWHPERLVQWRPLTGSWSASGCGRLPSMPYDEAAAAIKRGANHGTHLYNGMRGMYHREPGVVGAFCQNLMLTFSLSQTHSVHRSAEKLARPATCGAVILVTELCASHRPRRWGIRPGRSAYLCEDGVQLT